MYIGHTNAWDLGVGGRIPALLGPVQCLSFSGVGIW